MDSPHRLFDLLKDLLTHLPSLLAMLVCMVFAIVRWKRHPRVSLTVLIGLILLFLHAFVFSAIYNWVPDWYLRSAAAANHADALRNVYLVLGLAANSASAVIFAVLLAGIFMQRER